mgnify:CR=1 FL=1
MRRRRERGGRLGAKCQRAPLCSAHDIWGQIETMAHLGLAGGSAARLRAARMGSLQPNLALLPDSIARLVCLYELASCAASKQPATGDRRQRPPVGGGEAKGGNKRQKTSLRKLILSHLANAAMRVPSPQKSGRRFCLAELAGCLAAPVSWWVAKRRVGPHLERPIQSNSVQFNSIIMIVALRGRSSRPSGARAPSARPEVARKHPSRSGWLASGADEIRHLAWTFVVKTAPK